MRSPAFCALRLGTPPVCVGSDACSDPNHSPRASSIESCGGTSLAAGTEASRQREAASESCRDGAPLRAPRSLSWTRSSPRVGAVVRLRVSRCVPCGSPHRPSPVRAPGDDDIPITPRLASAWSGWWTPALRYRCAHVRGRGCTEAKSPAALLQSTVFNEHPRVAATSDLLAQSSSPRLGPCWPRCAARAGASSLSGDAATPWFRRGGLG